MMDTRLIFRDFVLLRWDDGVQYVSRIIGFVFAPSECLVGKSAKLLSIANSSGVKIPRFVKGNGTKRASKKSL